jgi:pseudouridylate synthase
MPYPKNLQMAMEVEAIIRDNGAIPATIAVLDGVPHVGQFSASPHAAGLSINL